MAPSTTVYIFCIVVSKPLSASVEVTRGLPTRRRVQNRYREARCPKKWSPVVDSRWFVTILIGTSRRWLKNPAAYGSRGWCSVDLCGDSELKAKLGIVNLLKAARSCLVKSTLPIVFSRRTSPRPIQ